MDLYNSIMSRRAGGGIPSMFAGETAARPIGVQGPIPRNGYAITPKAIDAARAAQPAPPPPSNAGVAGQIPEHGYGLMGQQEAAAQRIAAPQMGGHSIPAPSARGEIPMAEYSPTSASTAVATTAAPSAAAPAESFKVIQPRDSFMGNRVAPQLANTKTTAPVPSLRQIAGEPQPGVLRQAGSSALGVLRNLDPRNISGITGGMGRLASGAANLGKGAGVMLAAQAVANPEAAFGLVGGAGVPQEPSSWTWDNLTRGRARPGNGRLLLGATRQRGRHRDRGEDDRPGRSQHGQYGRQGIDRASRALPRLQCRSPADRRDAVRCGRSGRSWLTSSKRRPATIPTTSSRAKRPCNPNAPWLVEYQREHPEAKIGMASQAPSQIGMASRPQAAAAQAQGQPAGPGAPGTPPAQAVPQPDPIEGNLRGAIREAMSGGEMTRGMSLDQIHQLVADRTAMLNSYLHGTTSADLARAQAEHCQDSRARPLRARQPARVWHRPSADFEGMIGARNAAITPGLRRAGSPRV